MKAALFLEPGRMEIREVDTPRCESGDLLLKVEACAICGTDVRIFTYGQKNVQPPAIVGHEIAATIAEIGGDVSGYQVGERVVLVTPVGCGRCRFCGKGFHNLCMDFKAFGYDFSGGFAQYVRIHAAAVRQGNALQIPQEMPFDEAALIEPLSCCVNGQSYLDIGKGDSVVVFGAGPIGIMHVELARSSGATRLFLVEPDEKRQAMAKERVQVERHISAGREDPVQVVMEETEGFGADVAIVACSVHQAQSQALALAAKQGRVSFFAGLPKDRPTVEFDSNALHYREISVYGAFASHATQYSQAAALLASREVDGRKFITRKIPLEELPSVLRDYKNGNDLKVIVEPWN